MIQCRACQKWAHVLCGEDDLFFFYTRVRCLPNPSDVDTDNDLVFTKNIDMFTMIAFQFLDVITYPWQCTSDTVSVNDFFLFRVKNMYRWQTFSKWENDQHTFLLNRNTVVNSKIQKKKLYDNCNKPPRSPHICMTFDAQD